MYAEQQTTKPTQLPVSLERAKEFLRISGDDDNAELLDLYIPGATYLIEASTDRQLITAGWTVTRPSWGKNNYLPLPKGSLQEINAVTYLDTDGNRQTVDPTAYRGITFYEPALVIPKYGTDWPSALCEPDSIQVVFTCGYGDTADEVPELIQQAILLALANSWEQREPIVVGTSAAELPWSIQRLTEIYNMGDEWAKYGAAI